MKEKSQTPSRILFIAALSIVLAGTLISVTLFKKSGLGRYPIMIADAYREKQHHLTVPGSREVKLTRTGAYGIYYEYNLVSSPVGRRSENPPQIECTLKSTSTGTMIQTVPDYVESNTYWSKEKGGIGVLVMSLTLDEPGIYDFSCQYKDGRTEPEITVALGPNYVWEFFRVAGKIALSTLLWLTTCCGSALIGLAIIIIVVAIRIFRRKTVDGGRMSSNKFVFAQITIIALLLVGCNQVAEDHWAFVNVNLVPMTTEKVMPNQVVLVYGSKIVGIGDFETMKIPKGTKVIEGEGAYLMPGLADMHMHTRQDWDDKTKWLAHPLHLYLANGVTTIRDFGPAGSPITYPLQWRKDIRAGERIGPTIYTSGTILYASSLEDPGGMVRKNYELGFDFLKLYSYLSLDDFNLALRTAKELGMYTSGHIPYAVGLNGVLDEGMDEIAHVEELFYEFIDFDRDKNLPPEEWIPYIAESALEQIDLSSSSLQADFVAEKSQVLEQIVSQLRSAQVPVCTTMVVDDILQMKLFNPEEFLTRPENIYFESGYLDRFQQGEEKHQVMCRGMEGFCVFKVDVDRWVLKGLHESRAVLVLGTDAGTGGMGIVPGYSVHDELRILAENGFSPYEAIKTGTVNAGIVVERMTGVGNFGTLEVGKRADLILVRENPLEDITAIKEPLGVMAAGRWYPDEMLAELVEISASVR